MTYHGEAHCTCLLQDRKNATVITRLFLSRFTSGNTLKQMINKPRMTKTSTFREIKKQTKKTFRTNDSRWRIDAVYVLDMQ